MKDTALLSTALDELAGLGFTVIREEESGGYLLSNSEWASSFIMLLGDDWIQVASLLLGRQEIPASTDLTSLFQALLRVHQRFLGCRFALEDDGGISLRQDIPLQVLGSASILVAMQQIHWVANALLDAIGKSASTGSHLSDDEIDLAFASCISGVTEDFNG